MVPPPYYIDGKLGHEAVPWNGVTDGICKSGSSILACNSHCLPVEDGKRPDPETVACGYNTTTVTNDMAAARHIEFEYFHCIKEHVGCPSSYGLTVSKGTSGDAIPCNSNTICPKKDVANEVDITLWTDE